MVANIHNNIFPNTIRFWLAQNIEIRFDGQMTANQCTWKILCVSEEQKFSHQFEYIAAGKMQMNSNQMDVSFLFCCQINALKCSVVLLAGARIRLPLLNGSTFSFASMKKWASFLNWLKTRSFHLNFSRRFAFYAFTVSADRLENAVNFFLIRPKTDKKHFVHYLPLFMERYCGCCSVVVRRRRRFKVLHRLSIDPKCAKFSNKRRKKIAPKHCVPYGLAHVHRSRHSSLLPCHT